jgi:plasmid replication initiation protein
MAKINNKDVLQSYILTTAKYDYSVHEKRILYRLVEMAQTETEGLKFSSGDCRKIQHDLFGYVDIEMPISDILVNEKDKNHKIAKEALESLSQKYLIYEDSEVWEKINIVLSPKIQKFHSIIKFKLEPKIWDCMLDFSKGFRKYELKTAMQFESVYSMRFYELMSNQKSPLSYSVEALKEMFQIQNKYKQINDFTRFVIDPAKRELDAKSPYSFTYKPEKPSRKIIGFTFFPVYNPQHRDDNLETAELRKKISPAWDLSRPVLQYLKHQFEFTSTEVKTHVELFKTAQSQIDDFVLFMSKVKARANRAKNPKGYLINAIRKELKQT